MYSRVYETISHAADIMGHKVELHRFALWYGFLDTFATDDDPFHLVPTNEHNAAVRYDNPRLERLRLEKAEKRRANGDTYYFQLETVWYNNYEKSRYQPFVDGRPLCKPGFEYQAYEKIRERFGLEDKYVYRLFKESGRPSFLDPIAVYRQKEFEKANFSAKYAVGDHLYYVRQESPETRLGERFQVYDFTVNTINLNMGEVLYSSGNAEVISYMDDLCYEHQAAKTVEELIKRYEGRRLYMWRSDCFGIQPCRSTAAYESMKAQETRK